MGQLPSQDIVALLEFKKGIKHYPAVLSTDVDLSVSLNLIILVVQQTQHMLVSQFRSQTTKCCLMMVLILYLSLKCSLHLYVDIWKGPWFIAKVKRKWQLVKLS
ncbi:unnamed protein product, partial [Vitis vinifera]|uniref:Uncharacterized protein n=1 Tax=Vitis vinifera TaxID=29760 RepID=D7SX22_VITVI